ncbi:MAG: serpin family protein [Hyperionvirus sp.]|uniref:Serpin family protein n=1 Tax=Hyperionvirus sp. TaxID=2487770 RepID=A0A3G5A611_9VIRU|nr:MAG: serpin family protein [Hyperionvirus sp.]
MASLYETKSVGGGVKDVDCVFSGLFRKFERGGSNIFSPLSLEEALVVPYMGSDGDTQSVLAMEFNKVVPKEVSPIDFYSDFLNKQLTASGVVSIGNAIWVNNKTGFVANGPFVKSVEKLCRLESLPFDEKFQAIVDAFVNEKTKSMIKNGPKIDCADPTLCVIVLNTLFFEGMWVTPFSPAVEDNFMVGNGEIIKHPMMAVELTECKYYEDETMCAVELAYNHDFVMVVFLAKGKSLAVVDISDAKFSEVRRAMEVRCVDVLLPKFSAESTESMLEPLMELTYDKINGFYNKMGNCPLKITAIIQQCKIEVNESGTRAAAVATVIEHRESFTPSILFKADKPFTYRILHVPTAKVLFMGTYIGK